MTMEHCQSFYKYLNTLASPIIGERLGECTSIAAPEVVHNMREHFAASCCIFSQNQEKNNQSNKNNVGYSEDISKSGRGYVVENKRR